MLESDFLGATEANSAKAASTIVLNHLVKAVRLKGWPVKAVDI